MSLQLTPDLAAIQPTTSPQGLRGNSPSRQRRLVQVLTVALLVVPMVAYFWLIHHFARNVVFYDQWSDVRLVAHPSFSALWAQHNENRIFFPNLVVLLLAHMTQLNVVVEEFLSATLLVGATALIALAHHRRSPSTPWFAYFPLALLLFSFVQDGDTLWGFQLAWYMVLLALAGSTYLLDRPNPTWVVFAAAVIIAVAGSFSSLQGLLIWPVGMVLNYQRRRGGGWQLGWILSGVVTTVVYFYNLNSSAANPGGSTALTHLTRSLIFFLTAIGNIFGGQVYDVYGARVPGAPDLGPDGTIGLGVVVFVCAVLTLAIFVRRDEKTAGPIGVSLVLFGLLFAACMTIARSRDGLGGAGFSRYTTFDILVLAGCYLVLLGRPPTEHRRTWLPVVRSIIVALVALQVVLGTVEGIAYARSWERHEMAIANITENIDRASNAQIGAELYPNAQHFPWLAAEVRGWVHEAERQRLSLFSSKAPNSR